jgi:hypothetical protein
VAACRAPYQRHPQAQTSQRSPAHPWLPHSLALDSYPFTYDCSCQVPFLHLCSPIVPRPWNRRNVHPYDAQFPGHAHWNAAVAGLCLPVCD